MDFDFRKPMFLRTFDGLSSSPVMVEEIEQRFAEDPIVRARLLPNLKLGNFEFKPSRDGIAFGMVPVSKNKREFDIKDVIFNDPATIVMWSDGSKTVVKCQPGDKYSEELGLAMCIAKKYYGNTGAYNEVFKRFIPKESEDISIKDMRSKLREYCSARGCYECELSGPVCKCGRGKTLIPRFDTPKEFLLTDDEIRDAYARVFGKKEG